MTQIISTRMLAILGLTVASLVLKSECYDFRLLPAKVKEVKAETAGIIPGVPVEAAFFVRI